MLGGQNKKMPLGYTIVEVIIVLAISGMMFLIAANFINGKQEHTAFVQGTNDMVNQLQKIVDDVTDGHYSDIPLHCTNSSGAISISQDATGKQGATQDCVFLGKMISFEGDAQPTAYQLFSLAALRSYTNPDGSGTIPATGTTAVSAIPGLTVTGTIPQSLYIPNTATGKMTVTPLAGPPAVTSYSIGFVQGLGTTTDAGYTSGTQTVGLVYDSAMTDPVHGQIGANQENSSTSKVNGTYIRPAQSATICLSDGTRYAKIYIGGSTGGASSNNGNQLSISAQQLGTRAC
jgi:prepilin-type N-terminal cleavage/methylation domain-containing protein